MKKAGFKAALTAVALVFSGLALAQGMPAPNPAPATASPPGYDSRPEPGQKPAMHQGQRKHMKEGHHRKHMKDKHHKRPRHEGSGHGASESMPMSMPMHGQAGSDMQGQGAGPDHNFFKGGRLPQEYRNRQYVVDNWRDHNLTAPPRGHQWVQTGADYVLVGTSTGVIAQVMLAH